MPLLKDIRIRVCVFATIFCCAFEGRLAWDLVTPSVYAQDKSSSAATVEYATAIGLQNKRLYEQAGARWKQFLQRYPKDARVDRGMHNLGICQSQLKQYNEAISTFKSMLQKYPNFPSKDAALLNLGVAYYSLGRETKKESDLKTAAETFRQLSQQIPKSSYSPTALYYEAECCYASNQPDQAIAAYQKLIQNYSQSDLVPDAYYGQATLIQEQQNYARAAEVYAAFLKKFDKHEFANECRLRQGICLFALEKFPEAEKLFANLVNVKDFAYADFAMLRQADCFHRREDFDRAVSIYQTLIRKFPKSNYLGTAQLASGKCSYLQAKYPNAQSQLVQLVQAKRAESPEAAYWLAKTYLQLKKPNDAINMLDNILKTYPNDPYTKQLQVARLDALYEMDERKEQAIKEYSTFANENRDHDLAPHSLYMAALGSLNLQNHSDCQRYSEEFLKENRFAKHELVPEILFLAGESRVLLSEAMQKPEVIAQAQGFYRQLMAKHPEHRHATRAGLRVGLCLYLLKKHDEAVSALQQTTKQTKDPELLAEAHFLLGRNYHAKKTYPQAIASFQTGLRSNANWSRNDEVLLALAHAYRQGDQLRESQQQLQRLAQTYPKSRFRDQALFQLGEIADLQKNPDESIRYYQQLVNELPESNLAPESLYRIAAGYHSKGDDNQTISRITQLLAKHPKSESAVAGRYLRALSYQRQKKFPTAIEDLQSFLSTKPPEKEQLDAQYALGLCQVGSKQYPQAAQTFASILQKKPDYSQADKVRYEWGFALRDAKQEAAAAAQFLELATKHPTSSLAAEAWFRHGEFEEENKRWEPAAKSYQQGLGSKPNEELGEKLSFKLGWVHYQNQQFAPAAIAFGSQIKQYPKGSLLQQGTYFAAESFFKSGKWKEALPLFQQTIDAKPQEYHARALYRAGTCSANLLKWPESQQFYQKLMQQFPKFELINDARYGIGWALQNQEKLTEAVRAYEAVQREPPTETAAKARFMIGECFFREKKYQQAIEYFTEATVYPYPEWQALGHFESGRCFIELGKKEQAIESLETVLKDFPKHKVASDAQQLLATLKSS